jgi:hypothetical protein
MFVIRASKEAAEAMPLQEEAQKLKEFMCVIFVYLPLNLALLYLLHGHLSTVQILPDSFFIHFPFCAEVTNA